MTGAATETAALLDSLRERGGRYFSPPEALAEVRPLGTRRPAYSVIHRFRLTAAGGSQQEVVVKVARGAASQFAVLTSVWSRFASHPSWGVPRPLDFLPEHSALVMEAVAGVRLSDRLPVASWPERLLRRALDDCRRAGQWLRFYHDQWLAGDPAPLDVTAKLRGAEASLRDLSAGPLRRSARRLGQELAALAPSLPGHALPVSQIHGDFTVDNVLLAGSRVVVLDLGGRRHHVVFHDLATFANSLALLTLTRPALGQGALRRLEAAFSAGYFPDGPPDLTPLRFLQLAGLADVALEIMARRPSRLLAAWLDRVICLAAQRIATQARPGAG